MADNFPITPGTGRNAATDEVTFSGDTADVQIVRPAHVAGAEGSKTVEAVTQTAGSASPAAAVAVGGHDGTNLQRLRVDADGHTQVDVLTLPGVKGSIAHDTADADPPVKVGAKAVAHGSNPTAVAAADVTDVYANRHGIPFTIAGHPNLQTTVIEYTGAQTDASLVGTINSGTKVVVTFLGVRAANANTAFPAARIGFGATNTPTLGSAGLIDGHPGIPAGGGFNCGDGSGIIGQGGDGEEVRITSGAPTGGSLYVTLKWFTIES